MGDMKLSLAVWGQMLVRGCSPNILTFTSSMKGYFKKSRVLEALDVWNQMIQEGFLPNVIPYNVLLHVAFNRKKTIV